MRKQYDKNIFDKIKPKTTTKSNWASDLFNIQKNNTYEEIKQPTNNKKNHVHFKTALENGKFKLIIGMILYIVLFVTILVMGVKDIYSASDYYKKEIYHNVINDLNDIKVFFNKFQLILKNNGTADISSEKADNKISYNDKDNTQLPADITSDVDKIMLQYPFIDVFYYASYNPEYLEEKNKITIHNIKINTSSNPLNNEIYNNYSSKISKEISEILYNYKIETMNLFYFDRLKEKSAYYILPTSNNKYIFLRINQDLFSQYFSINGITPYFKNNQLEKDNPNIDKYIFNDIQNNYYLLFSDENISYMEKVLIYFGIFLILNLTTIIGYNALCSYYLALTRINLLNNELKLVYHNKSGHESRMQHLIESTNLVPWMADPETNSFTYVGHQITDITGINYQTWLTPGFWLSHVHESDRDVFYKALVNVKNQVYVTAEYKIFNNVGDVRWLRNTISKSSYKEESQTQEKNMLQGFIIDITDQKRVLETLEAARKTAEKASQMKSNFLASMSHELRTPLNSIIGFADIIKSIQSESNMISEYSQNILLSGRHLLDLINDILDYSKIEAGEFEIRVEPCSLADIFKACQTLLQSRASQSNISLLVKIPDDNIYVNADSIRIKQVLINLLTNAIKFNRPNGKVALVYEFGEQGELLLKVTDTGIGMKPDDLKVALEKFRQVDGSKNRNQEGTGLGLSISKSLVELHGGKLSINSIYEKGTQITLTFPKEIIYQINNQNQMNNKNSA